MDKHKKYRQKMLSQNRCPHCGVFCEPYKECFERREYKRARRNKGKKTTKFDNRRTPRAGGVPVLLIDEVVNDLISLDVDISPNVFCTK